MPKKEKTDEKNIKKENVKKSKKKDTKKVQKESYMDGVKSELGKVKWPSKKEVMKYTIATISFVVILVAFFVLLNLGMSVIKGAFN